MYGLAWGIVGVVVVTTCKWTVTYGKTTLFLVFHSSAAQTSPDAPFEDKEDGLSHDGDETDDVPPKTDDVPPDLFRWAGAGMQVGGLIGSIVFFILTVPFHIIDN